MVGSDLDDTFWDFMTPLLIKYNEKYKDNLKCEDISDYDIRLFIKPECTDIFKEFVDDNFIMNLKPKENAVEVISKINEKHNLVFPTSGHPKTATSRDKKLSQIFSWYSTKQLIVCQNKQLLKLDYLFDDCFKNVDGSEYKCLLFEQPWNVRRNNLTENIRRVNNWSNINNIFFGG